MNWEELTNATLLFKWIMMNALLQSNTCHVVRTKRKYQYLLILIHFKTLLSSLISKIFFIKCTSTRYTNIECLSWTTAPFLVLNAEDPMWDLALFAMGNRLLVAAPTAPYVANNEEDLSVVEGIVREEVAISWLEEGIVREAVDCVREEEVCIVREEDGSVCVTKKIVRCAEVRESEITTSSEEARRKIEFMTWQCGQNRSYWKSLCGTDAALQKSLQIADIVRCF